MRNTKRWEPGHIARLLLLWLSQSAACKNVTRTDLVCSNCHAEIHAGLHKI